MSHHIQILARPAPGALERILRTLRVRGFELSRMQVELDAHQRYRVHLRIAGSRAPENLERQLEKLADVEQVLAIYAAESGAATAG